MASNLGLTLPDPLSDKNPRGNTLEAQVRQQGTGILSGIKNKFAQQISIEIGCQDSLDAKKKTAERIVKFTSSLSSICRNADDEKLTSIASSLQLDENSIHLTIEKALKYMYFNDLWSRKQQLILLGKEIEKIITWYIVQKIREYFFKTSIASLTEQEIGSVNNIFDGLKEIFLQQFHNLSISDLRKPEIQQSMFRSFINLYSSTNPDQKSKLFKRIKELTQSSNSIYKQMDLVHSMVIENFSKEYTLSHTTANLCAKIKLFDIIRFKLRMGLEDFLTEFRQKDIEGTIKSCNPYLAYRPIPYAEAGHLFSYNPNNPTACDDKNYSLLTEIQTLEFEHDVIKLKSSSDGRYIIILMAEGQRKPKQFTVIDATKFSTIAQIRFMMQAFFLNDKLIGIKERDAVTGNSTIIISLQTGGRIRSFDLRKAIINTQEFEKKDKSLQEKGVELDTTSPSKQFYNPLDSEQEGVNCANYSPDGKIGARVQNDNEIIVQGNKQSKTLSVNFVFIDFLSVCEHRIETGRDYPKLTLPLLFTDKIQRISFSPDGKTICIIFANGNVKFIDIIKYKEIALNNKDLSANLINSLKRKTVIEVTDLSQILELQKNISSPIGLNGNNEGYKSSYDFSTDGKYFVTGTNLGKVQVIDLEKGKLCLEQKFHQSVGCVKMIPQTNYLISGGTEGKLIITDLEDNSSIYEQDFKVGINTIDVDIRGNIIIGLANKKVKILKPQDLEVVVVEKFLGQN